MSRWTAHIFILLIPLVGASCASDVANRYYGSTHYPAKPAKEVELLRAAPDRPDDVIADYQSRNEGPESLRRKAGEIGADAVIVTTLGGQFADDWASQKGDWPSSYTRIVGTAIKYK